MATTSTIPDCAICGTKMEFAFSDDEASYFLCGNCDYLAPVLERFDTRQLNNEIYSERFDAQLEVAAKLNSKRRRKYARLVANVAPYRSSNRFLDIGCGAGRLLQVLAEEGWDAYGVDPAMERLAAQAPEGVTIIPKLLHEAGFEPGFFDVVHANEVFEHVEDPKELVEQILQVLRPGGLLVFRTPNHRSWTAQAVGVKWRQLGVQTKGHVGFFSPASARRLLGDHGFDRVWIDTHHFSMRDRYPVQIPGVGGLLRLGYRCVGQMARLLDRGERLTVYGELAAAGAGE